MIKDYKYKFSVIMPIYNVEPYLDAAIDSVIRQSIGFEENIQLILVNDGSTDDSGAICAEYKNRYPNNVIYIEQANQGVSAARNAGIPYIEGKYVNFFDSDDIWEKDAFILAWEYMESHSNEVDLVCCKEVFFEGQTGEPVLNNKFRKGTRIIDVNEEPEYVHVSIKSSFIDSETAKSERFDTEISVGEDVKYLAHVILKRGKYGVLDKILYNFRRRAAKTSITQNPNIGRYTKTMEHYYKYLLDHSEQEYGKLLPYIQHTVLHGLKYRVLEKPVTMLSAEQWQKYTEDVISLISRLDDEIIASTGNVKVSTKLHLLKLKYKKDIEEEVYIDDDKLCFRGIPLSKVPSNAVTVDKISVSWRKIDIAGTVKIPINDNIGLFIRQNGRYNRIEIRDDDKVVRNTFTSDKIVDGRKFNVSMSKKNADMTFYLGKKGNFVNIVPKQ